MEPNLDWCVVDRAVENAFWASKGGIVELKIGISDGEWRGKGSIVKGGFGIAKEVDVCKEHGVVVEVARKWARNEAEWWRKAREVACSMVFDW